MYGNRHKTLGQRLDDMVNGAGLYAIAVPRRPEPRNLRFLPILVLAALAIGYVLAVVGWGGPHPSRLLGIVGGVLFFAGFLAANYVRFFGPRIFPDVETDLDERERMLRARAGSASGAVVTALVMLGCFYLAAAQVFDWWTPHHPNEWIYCALLIQGWAFTLPVLIASWMQPPDIDEDA